MEEHKPIAAGPVHFVPRWSHWKIDLFSPIIGAVYVSESSKPIIQVNLKSFDSQSTIEFINEKLEEFNPDIDIDVTEQNDTEIYDIENRITIFKRGDIVIMMFCERRGSALNLSERIIDEDYKSITEVEKFNLVLSAYENEHVLVYFDATQTKFRNALRKSYERSDVNDIYNSVVLDDINSMVLATSLKDKHFRIGASVIYDDSSEILTSQHSTNKSISGLSIIKGDALLISKIAFDLEDAFENLNSRSMREANETINNIEDQFNVNMKEDVIPFIGSPMAFALTPEDLEGEPFGGVFWVPLKAGHNLDSSIKKFVNVFEEEGMDIDTYKNDDVYWYSYSDNGRGNQITLGIQDDILVLYYGEKLVESSKSSDTKVLNDILTRDIEVVLNDDLTVSSVSVVPSQIVKFLENLELNDSNERKKLEISIIKDALNSVLQKISSVDLFVELNKSMNSAELHFMINTSDGSFYDIAKEHAFPAFKKYEETIIEYDRRTSFAYSSLKQMATSLKKKSGVELSDTDWCPKSVSENASLSNCASLNELDFDTSQKSSCSFKFIPTIKNNRIIKCNNTCRYARDGMCDEPNDCRNGTDCYDCGPSEIYKKGAKLITGYEIQSKCIMPGGDIIAYQVDKKSTWPYPVDPTTFDEGDSESK